MKKILAIFSIVTLFALAAQAQTVASLTLHTTTTSAVDSVRCNGTVSAYLYCTPTLSYKCASFVPVITRISAAIGGSVTLEGSNNNSNYFTVTGLGIDTIKPATVADAASQALSIVVKPTNGLPYRYYRLKCTGASSDTMTVKATFTGR